MTNTEQEEKNNKEVQLKQLNTLYEGDASYLIFSVKKHRYALKGSQILQIVNAQKVRALPFVPAFVEGILNIHGTPYAAVNTLLMDEEEDCEIPGSAYIILKRDDDHFSIHVSNIELFCEPEKEEIFADKIRYKQKFIPLFDSDRVEKRLFEALSEETL